MMILNVFQICYLVFSAHLLPECVLKTLRPPPVIILFLRVHLLDNFAYQNVKFIIFKKDITKTRPFDTFLYFRYPGVPESLTSSILYWTQIKNTRNIALFNGKSRT
jgi:hypothetical protein